MFSSLFVFLCLFGIVFGFGFWFAFVFCWRFVCLYFRFYFCTLLLSLLALIVFGLCWFFCWDYLIVLRTLFAVRVDVCLWFDLFNAYCCFAYNLVFVWLFCWFHFLIGLSTVCLSLSGVLDLVWCVYFVIWFGVWDW